MQAEQLREALAQTLDNYRRCGLSRIVTPESHGLSQDVLEAISKLGEASSSPNADVQAGGGTNPDRQSRMSVAADAVGAPAEANSKEADRHPAPQGTGPTPQTWTLPVLSDTERQQRFEALDAEVRACRHCSNIVDYRRQTVFGDGTLRPTLCFMGEAPGADEDRQGLPFVGRAGQLLTKIIKAMNLERQEVYILNALKCRPPQNRTPVPEEIESCRHFVETQLEVLQPKYLVCLGAVAVRSVLQSNLSIGRLRGRFHHYRGARVVVTYHPSYLLRNEDAKRLVWDDMKMLMRDMEATS